eukprot:maker-scaffold514_size150699-snap-gene-0.27 protein:Tk01731 transcript:maker-scaffold514_size150699-snap-gene-0.27-mRNA-1 annotation:"far upstream element-binding protein 3 isoform x4"
MALDPKAPFHSEKESYLIHRGSIRNQTQHEYQIVNMSQTYAMRPPEPATPSRPPSPGPSVTLPDHVKRVIHVPTRKVGYLIGYQGRTILGFERDTGAKINILEPNSRDSETPVSLTGLPESVRHVIRMITDLYGCNNYSSQLWNPRLTSNGFKWSQLLGTEEIRVEVLIAGLLIGTRGDLIATIEAKTGAKITFHQDQEDGSGVPINVTGTLKSNSHALEILGTRISEFRSLLEAGALDLKNVQLHSLQKRKVWTVEKIRESFTKKRPWSNGKDTPGSSRHGPNSAPPKKKACFFSHNNNNNKNNNQVQPIEDKIQMTGHELDTVNLESIALLNDVELEVVNVIGKATSSGGLKHINVRSVQLLLFRLRSIGESGWLEGGQSHFGGLALGPHCSILEVPLYELEVAIGFRDQKALVLVVALVLLLDDLTLVFANHLRLTLDQMEVAARGWHQGGGLIKAAAFHLIRGLFDCLLNIDEVIPTSHEFEAIRSVAKAGTGGAGALETRLDVIRGRQRGLVDESRPPLASTPARVVTSRGREMHSAIKLFWVMNGQSSDGLAGDIWKMRQEEDELSQPHQKATELSLLSESQPRLGEAIEDPLVRDTGDCASVKRLLTERADAFAQFASRNGLVLNAGNSQFMVGGTIKAKDLASLSISISGVEVRPAKEMELLGVKFDTNFSTSPHNATVAATARQRAGLIGRLVHHLPRGQYLRQLARGLVVGKVGFGAAAVASPRLAEDNAPPSKAYKAVQVANDVARTRTGQKRKDWVRITDLLNLAGLSLMNELAVRAIALEAWKAFHSSDGENGGRNPLGNIIFPSVQDGCESRPSHDQIQGGWHNHAPSPPDCQHLRCSRVQHVEQVP